MGYGPRMQQPPSQSQFLSQPQFPAQGMNVTNMPLAPSGGQVPVSQVCPPNLCGFCFKLIYGSFKNSFIGWNSIQDKHLICTWTTLIQTLALYMAPWT